MTDKIKKDGSFAALRTMGKAVVFLLFALALLLEFSVLSKNAVGCFFLGLFSGGAHFIALFLVIHACFYARDLYKKTLVLRVSLSLFTLLVISSLFFIAGAPSGFEPREFYFSGIDAYGGGFIGGIFAYGLSALFSNVGVGIIAVFAILGYIAFTVISGKKFFSRLLLSVLTFISDRYSKRQERLTKMRELEKEREEKEEAERQTKLSEDDFFISDKNLSELAIPKLGIREVNTARLEAPVEREKIEAAPESATKPESKSKKHSTSIFDYGIDKSLPQPETVKSAFDERPKAKNGNTYLGEENADAVFNSSFNGFDVKINRELAKKPSSRADEVKKESITEIATPVYTISPEEVEKARQRADFEMKKKAFSSIETEKSESVYFDGEDEDLEIFEEENESENALENSSELESVFVENDFSNIEISNDENEDFEDTITDEFSSAIEESEAPTLVMQREPVSSPFFEEEEDEEETPQDEFEGEARDEIYEGEQEEDEEEYYSPIPEEEQNPAVKEYRKMFSFLSDEDEGEKEESPEAEVEDEYQDEAENVDEAPFEIEPEVKVKPQAPEQSETKEKAKEAPKPDYSKYKFPPIDLLSRGQVEEDENSEEETRENAEKLVETLAQFSVKVSLKGYDRGPRITRYEIVPAKGVKVNQVTNLFDDIALSMAADGIRMEAPIPGKSAIGVEIPNKKPSLVFLRDLIETDDFIREESKTCAAIGKDVTGNPVFGDISKMPHVLIAGATGMGKSVCINAVLISILYKARPDEVKLIMIDPKRVEFNSYNGIPHLLIPVVTEVKQAAGALMWAVEQMNKRYDLMGALEVKKLDEYNELVRENPSLGEPLPKIIIVIDELNDIMLQARKPVEGLIMSIAQKARAAGIHLILGTQRPSVDVITGVIKSNIPSRISCKVMSFQDSKTIIDQAGAEKLLNNGDMLYFPNGSPKPLRVQGAYVSNGEVSKIMRYLKEQTKGIDIYDQKALDEINNAAKKCVKGGGDDEDDETDGEENSGILHDQQFLDAVDLALKSGKVSTSLLQRRIGVGYGKAAKFIDYMEDLGIVSEPNGQKPRDILIDKDTWYEMLARREMD